MSDEERIILTADEAIAMLPEKESIHTFLQGGMTLLGADWPAEEIWESLRQSVRIELSGPTATSMGHGLVFWRGAEDNGSWVFVETRRSEG